MSQPVAISAASYAESVERARLILRLPVAAENGIRTVIGVSPSLNRRRNGCTEINKFNEELACRNRALADPG